MNKFPFLLLPLLAAASWAQTEPLLAPHVVTEETMAVCLPANNGAGPLWCFGSPLLFRDGKDVYASIMETGEGIPLLCNTRWRLFHRADEKWNLVRAAEEFRIREPSPLGGFSGGPVFLSINPSIEPPGTQYGHCQPQLLAFDPKALDQPPGVEIPVWDGTPHFTDHSYRGVAFDGPKRELLWVNIDATTSIQHWSFRDREGNWARQGSITFPIRACYPQVALSNHAAHVLAIGDIVEPIMEWREYKYAQSNQKWDYVFRRLFYTSTPDITTTEFAPPIEVDTLESTSGQMTNLDLWIGPDGAAHLLYIKTSVQSAVMRDRFFPGLPIIRTLNYVVIREGGVVKRELLAVSDESGAGTNPIYGRFHSTPDGRLWAVYFANRKDGQGQVKTPLILTQVWPTFDRAHPVEVQLAHPINTFFTATERGGSKPSNTLDLFGLGSEPNTLRYAQIDLVK
jgi:hypothetical protein